MHVPMTHTLKFLFEIDGLLDVTLNYLQFLESQLFSSPDSENPTVMFNFVRGSNWTQLLENFKKPGIKLPLVESFDDVECRNALGSHVGENI